MKKLSHSYNTQLIILTIALLSLPGCAPLDWIKSKFSSNPTEVTTSETPTEEATKTAAPMPADVLVTVEGKPTMTVAQFEKEYDTLVQNNPQVKELIHLMPDLDEQYFDGLVNQQLVDLYITKNKIDESAEYKKQMEDLLKGAKQILNETYFTKQFPATVSDEEVRKYYEENKATIPDLIISFGGVNTQGVVFDTEADAKAFATKAKGKSKEFEKLAKDSGFGAKFRDFKLINPQSVGVDQAVRNKVITIKTFPTIEVVQGNDKKFWVINAVNQEEPKYQEFAKIKDLLKQAVTQEKQNAVKREQLKKLEKQYNVQVNKGYFQQKKQGQKADRMQKLQEALLQTNEQSEQAAPAPRKAA